MTVTATETYTPRLKQLYDTELKARLKDEPGTLQFDVLLPKGDDTKVYIYELYRDAAAFETHIAGPSLAQWKRETAGMVKLQGVRCSVVAHASASL